MIFVSIASYRDPELLPTIEDCMQKAAYPESLRFGICWQHEHDESLPPLFRDRRFRIMDVDWRDGRGVGWARAEIMSLFAAEDFYLQLDSHHRFVEGWDEKLIKMAESCGSSRPLLTTYAASYYLDEREPLRFEPRRIEFGRWDGHIPLFRPGVVRRRNELGRPTRARFVSGHFCFSIGDFVRDLPYDPDIYFNGEEILLTVRAYTSGYDLFHPSEAILWHHYERGYRRTHWEDHDVAAANWDDQSKEKVSRFLRGPNAGYFGCGTLRTLSDYENYAGINFRNCRVQTYTRLNREPPNPPVASDWADRPRDWALRLRLTRNQLTEGFLQAEKLELSFQDALGRDVHDVELEQPAISRLLEDVGEKRWVSLRFDSAREPALWSARALCHGDEVGVTSGIVGRATRTGAAFFTPAAMSEEL